MSIIKNFINYNQTIYLFFIKNSFQTLLKLKYKNL